MRIIILLLIIGLSFASAKYIPQERSDSEVLLRIKRSDSDESVASIERDSEESGDSYNDNGDAKVEEKRIKEQIKLREKEEKLQQKQMEKLEKEKRRYEEQQRRHQEKLAKEARKEQEKKEREERKRQERLEKEKQKQEEEERKVEEKLRKEQLKKQEKERKELNNLQKDVLEQSDEDDFLETEEESSVELEDIWRSHIYVKYGLTFASTKVEKQAALNKYLQEELGLNPNSTVSERRQAISKLIQNKLESDPALRESLKNQILSQINEVTIQKLKAKLENDIVELDNKTELLNNVSLLWAIQAQQNITDKKTFLQSVVQFLSSLLPNWITDEQTRNFSPESIINTTANDNNNNGLSTSGSYKPSVNKILTTDGNFILESSGTTKFTKLPINDNEKSTDKHTNLADGVSVSSTSQITETENINGNGDVKNVGTSVSNISPKNKSLTTDGNIIPENSDTSKVISSSDPRNNKEISTDQIIDLTDNVLITDTSTINSSIASDYGDTLSTTQITEQPKTINENENVTINIETDNKTNQSNVALTIDDNSLVGVTVSSVKVSDINSENSTLKDKNATPVSETISEKPVIANVAIGQSVKKDSVQNDATSLYPNENKVSVTDSVNSKIDIERSLLKSNIDTTPSVDSPITDNVVSTTSESLPNVLDNSVDKPSKHNDLEINENTNVYTISVDSNPSPIDAKNSVNSLSIKNDSVNDIIQNNSENSILSSISLPTNSEGLVDNPVISNNIKPIVVNENNVLTESTVNIDAPVTISSVNSDFSNNVALPDSESPQGVIRAGIDNNANIFITEINGTKIFLDNNSTPSALTTSGTKTEVTNDTEKNVGDVENVITTESSRIVITVASNSDILATSDNNILNSNVTLIENIETSVLSTSNPIVLDTKSSEPTANEVKVSSTLSEILNNNNYLSTASSINAIADTTPETATIIVLPDITIVSVDNVTDTSATNISLSPDSGLTTNTSEIFENLITPVTETVQTNSIPTDLLLNKVEAPVNNPSSIAITVSKMIVDTTVTTEVNLMDGITVPVEPGAAIVEITSQTI